MFEKIRRFYGLGLWSREMVARAVEKGQLTEEQFREIVGEV